MLLRRVLLPDVASVVRVLMGRVYVLLRDEAASLRLLPERVTVERLVLFERSLRTLVPCSRVLVELLRVPTTRRVEVVVDVPRRTWRLSPSPSVRTVCLLPLVLTARREVERD